MPIRAIKSKKYNGVKELYSAKTGIVNGYYIQYRDEYGDIQKYRSHESTNRDEALLHLNQCKHDVIRAKQDISNVSTTKRLKRIKLNDLADEYFTAKIDVIDKRVAARYTNHVREESIGSMVVDNITVADVEGLKTILTTKVQISLYSSTRFTPRLPLF